MKVLYRQFLPFVLLCVPVICAQTPEQSTTANTAAAEAVPSGTTLHIRLRQTVSSFGSKLDTPISAIVAQPVEIDGQIVLPMNAELHGVVARVRRAGVGLSHETAQLDLQFDTLILPEGQPQPLAGRITAVDNSRETVDSQGVIHGIRATASTAKVLSGLAISAAALDPMSQLFAASASLSAFRIPESEIILPVGTELTHRVDQPIPVTRHFPGIPAFFKDTNHESDLTALVRPLPFSTETTKPVTPSDLIGWYSHRKFARCESARGRCGRTDSTIHLQRVVSHSPKREVLSNFRCGGGFKYQITPRFFLRADFRQTLSPQPDYWTKSYPTLRKDLVEDPGDSVEIKPYKKFGPLRQNVTTVGLGISF